MTGTIGKRAGPATTGTYSGARFSWISRGPTTFRPASSRTRSLDTSVPTPIPRSPSLGRSSRTQDTVRCSPACPVGLPPLAGRAYLPVPDDRLPAAENVNRHSIIASSILSIEVTTLGRTLLERFAESITNLLDDPVIVILTSRDNHESDTICFLGEPHLRESLRPVPEGHLRNRFLPELSRLSFLFRVHIVGIAIMVSYWKPGSDTSVGRTLASRT